MKPFYRCIGRWVPAGIHPSIDGRVCYWFHDQNHGGLSYIIPVDRFWGRK